MWKGEEIPRTDAKEIEALIERVRGYEIERRDAELIERLLRTVMMLLNVLERKNLTISKLKAMIFGPRTEKQKGRAREEKPGWGEEERRGEMGKERVEDSRAANKEEQSAARAEKGGRKGHGRRAASDYSGAKAVSCQHTGYKTGDRCPDGVCKGHLYDRQEPRMLLQFTGQPLITATRYEREVLRCSACQEQYVAPLPEGVADQRYDATADATIALMRYGGGMPWHRQARLQAMGGVPLSEATMWERCEATGDAGLGVFQELMKLGANGEVMYTDDTRVRILSCLKEDEEEKGRATQTSALVVKADGRQIVLYQSGRRHAGENLSEMLKQRGDELGRPIQMSDALAANTSVEKEVTISYCLAHARRKVFELKDVYPAECEVVLEAVGKVYRYEAESQALSASQRLEYHRAQSGPVMEELKKWIEEQFAERKVEPNSSLGQALKYWLKHWEKLTLWLREAGTPLDNNAAERALKQYILMRKNSLFFNTEHGAAIGDILSSLIETCRVNGVNAWEYLVTIIRNKADARRNPDLYLPWNYRRDSYEARAA